MAGKPQRELADLLGVSPQTILLYERGAIGVSINRLGMIAAALGVDANRLMDTDNRDAFRMRKPTASDRARPYTSQEKSLIEAFSKIPDLPRKRLALQVVRSLADLPISSRTSPLK